MAKRSYVWLVALGLVVGACSAGAKSAATSSTSDALSNIPVETSTSTTLALHLRNLSLPQLRIRFQQDVAQDPRDKYGWYNLGVIAEDDQDSDAAATYYDKAIALDPTFESALYNLGILRFQAHDYPAAVALLTRAVAADPRDVNARTDLNEVRRALGTTSPMGIRASPGTVGTVRGT